MKYLLLVSAFLFIATACSSQTKGTAELVGYKQAVLGGAVPKSIIDESGNETFAPRRSVNNYFIYLLSPSRVYPMQMWINGEPFSINTQTVTSPVVVSNENVPSNKKEIILVPKTNKKVVQLVLAPPVQGKQLSVAKSLISANEVVVLYKLNGKNYYQVVKTLKALEPAAMQ